ncbi:GNAT family N-acetyltransferase, partial [Serratia marcescens]|nr:GNAT family N-acetyltransferase [Serratia marcescens]
MKECHIEISDRVTPEITSCIAEGLDRFNDQQIGYGDRLPLAVVVKDPDSGDVLGGITGRSSLGLLFLDLFYLPEALRGAGLGSELLRRFEQEGRRRGCLSAVLYT